MEALLKQTAGASEGKGKHAADSRMNALGVSCEENCVPAYAETELDRLYGNVFSCLAHFRSCGGLPANASTYVARKNGEIAVLLLYRQSGRQVRVLNEGMVLDAAEVKRFADTMFDRYPAAGAIILHAVPTEGLRLPYPLQQYTCTEDIVVDLPQDANAYLASLSRNNRRNVRRHMDKLVRAHPSFEYRYYEREQIDEQDVRAIVEFSKARIAGKGLDFAIGEPELKQISALLKERGMVGVARIDGRVCGGCIGYLVGSSFFSRIVAHDPRYNDYSLGFLCSYLSICESISRGCRQFNFMQDGYPYKFALGARVRPLQHVVIYRGRKQMLSNAGTVAKTAFAACQRSAKHALLRARSRVAGAVSATTV